MIRHGETDCLENAGRLTARTYRASVLYTTLSPCLMCAGSVLLYQIPRIVVGENRTFESSEALLRSRGVQVDVLDDSECRELMARLTRRSRASGTRTSGWSRRRTPRATRTGQSARRTVLLTTSRNVATRVVHRPLRTRPWWLRCGRHGRPGVGSGDGRERSLDAGVEVVAVQRLEQPVAQDQVLQPAPQLDEGEVDALRVELAGRAGRASSAAVTSMSVTASHWSTTQRGCRSRDEAADLLAEDAGVGEEQRRLPAEDHDAGDSVGAGAQVAGCASPGRRPAPRTAPCGHQLRRKNSRIDERDGDDDPCSTPKRTTPAVAASDSDAAVRRTRQ